MNKQQLADLLGETGKPCITIIIPTHNLTLSREVDAKNVSKEIDNTRSIIEKHYSDSRVRDRILKDLDLIGKDIDYSKLTEGLGFYISPNYCTLVHFPFEVKKKLVVSDSFDSKELLYAISIDDYYLLALSKKYFHLYKCTGKEAEEIKNSDFPMEYQEEFEYVKPAVANSFSSGVLVNYEKIKAFYKRKD